MPLDENEFLIRSVHCCCLQAFAKDAKLLTLLKTLISQHGSLADTPASKLSPEQVKQLQQVCLWRGSVPVCACVAVCGHTSLLLHHV